MNALIVGVDLLFTEPVVSSFSVSTHPKSSGPWNLHDDVALDWIRLGCLLLFDTVSRATRLE